MRKLWTFIRTNFLTKKFLTFGIIGVINTGIHLLVYVIVYKAIERNVVDSSSWANLSEFLSKTVPFWANTVAFIVSSVFSYFANAFFTFKPKKKNTMQFSIVMLVYLLRLLTSNGLTTLFDYIIINGFHVDYNVYPIAINIAPFLGSALLIPIAYFALDYVFKKTDKKE